MSNEQELRQPPCILRQLAVVSFAEAPDNEKEAQRDIVVVLPSPIDRAASNEKSKEALGHLYTSLSGRNFVTIPAENVEKKLLTSPGPACDVRGDCGLNLVRTFNADFGASAIVWKPTSKNSPSSVAVFLFAARGKRFEGRADVRNDDLRAAIDEATAKAVHAKRIEMPVTPARVTEHPAQPVPNAASEPKPNAEKSPSKPSPWNYVLAGGVAAASLYPLISGIMTYADNGQCTGQIDAAGRCSFRVQADAGTAALIGVGVAGLAGAAVIAFWWKPIRVAVDADHKHAGLVLSGSF